MLLAALALALTGCQGRPIIGTEELPPGITRQPGLFADVGPRWSPDGTRIAFLRRTTDRRYQLCLADASLSQIAPVLQPEIINPDRTLHTGRSSYRAPDGVVWAPDSRRIAYSRVEWFTFEDGEKLPGTGLWEFEIASQRVTRLAVHKRKYNSDYYFFRNPQWSPNGRMLAFTGEGLHGDTALFMRALDGTEPDAASPRFEATKDIGWPVWSPDGKRLAFRQGVLRGETADPLETMRLIEPGGQEARRLYATTPARYLASFGLPLQGRARELASLSLQGGSDAVERVESIEQRDPLGLNETPTPSSPLPPTRNPNRAASLPSAEPRSAGVQEASMTPLVPRVSGLCWSPDGTRVAFALTSDALNPQRYSLWTLEAVRGSLSTAPPQRVSPKDGRGYLAPVWIDNATLGALSPFGQDFEAVALPLAGGGVKTLCRLPSDDMDWSPDRRHIVCAVPAMIDAGKQPSSSTTLRLYNLSR